MSPCRSGGRPITSGGRVLTRDHPHPVARRYASRSAPRCIIGGIATYAFFKIGTWAVGGADDFNPISSLWFATFALAPGFFLPLEQEIGRALSHRRAIDQGGRPVVQQVARLSAVMVVVVLLAILAASPLLATNYFDGDWVMVVALMVAFAAYAPAILARGICSGSGRFQSYALVMGSDGVVRIVLCVALAVLGVKAAGAYGFAVALTPLVGFGVVWYRGAPAHRRGAGGAVERGHAEPRLAAARLGVRRHPAQRRADRHDDPGRAGPEDRGDEVRLRRPVGPHPAVPVPGRAGRPAPPASAGSPPATSSGSSAPGSSGC